MLCMTVLDAGCNSIMCPQVEDEGENQELYCKNGTDGNGVQLRCSGGAVTSLCVYHVATFFVCADCQSLCRRIFDCQLTGTISTSIGELTALQILYANRATPCPRLRLLTVVICWLSDIWISIDWLEQYQLLFGNCPRCFTCALIDDCRFSTHSIPISQSLVAKSTEWDDTSI